MPPPSTEAVLLLTVLPTALTVCSAEIPPPNPWVKFPSTVLLARLIDTVQTPPPNSLLVFRSTLLPLRATDVVPLIPPPLPLTAWLSVTRLPLTFTRPRE